MNKKVLFWFVVMILAAVFVRGDLSTDLVMWHSFNNNTSNSTSWNFDEAGSYDMGPTNTVDRGYEGQIIDAFNLDGVNEKLATSTFPDALINDWIGISAWIYQDVNTNTECMVCKQYNFEFGYRLDKITFAYYNTSDQIYEVAHDVNTGAWTHIAMTFKFGTPGSMSIWKNGINVSSGGSWAFGDGTDSAGSTDLNLQLTQGHYLGAANFFDGKIDAVGLWNRSLTNSEVLQLYNGTPREPPWGAAPPPTTDDINITAAEPNTSNSFNLPRLELNITFDSANQTDVNLYLNGTVNQTVSSVGSGSDITVGFNLTFESNEEINYTWFAQVTDGDQDENSTEKIFYIDNVDPQISNNTNMTKRIGYNSLFMNTTFIDTYLYSYNVSYCSSEDHNASLGGATSIIYDETLDISGCSNGTNYLLVNLTDGHTAKHIGEYDNKVLTKENALQYDFDKGFVKIKPKEADKFNPPRTVKRGDRYEFTFNKKELPGMIEEFYIESDHYIDIVDSNVYKGWLVIPALNKWIDFENDYDKAVITHRVNQNKVLIQVWGMESKAITFHSIGDLNTILVNYSFYKYNTTESYEPSLVAMENTDYTLAITYDSTYISSTDANVTIDGTLYNPTKNSYAGYDLYTHSFSVPDNGSDYNLSHFWNFSVIGVTNNDSNSTPEVNQTVSQAGIDNCSTFTMSAIEMWLKNASDDTLVTGSIEGNFAIWVNNMSSNNTYNLSFPAGGTNHSICLYPDYADYYLQGQLEFSATGFDTGTYYFYNTSIDNITNNITLHLGDSAETSLVSFTVVDQDDTEQPNVYIHVLKYDLPTDTSTTGLILKTDTNGAATGNLVLNTQWYKFILYLDGEIVLETTPVILTSTTHTFRISTLTDYFENYDVVRGVSCSLSYDNATTTFSYTFSDPTSTITNACLRVTRVAVQGSTTYNTTCSSGASGTITSTITPTGTATYTGDGYIYIDGESFMCGNTTSYSFDTTYKTFDQSGLFVAFLLTLTLVMVGVWSPVASVFLMLVSVIFLGILGLFHLSWPIMVGVVILGIITMYKLNTRR